MCPGRGPPKKNFPVGDLLCLVAAGPAGSPGPNDAKGVERRNRSPVVSLLPTTFLVSRAIFSFGSFLITFCGGWLRNRRCDSGLHDSGELPRARVSAEVSRPKPKGRWSVFRSLARSKEYRWGTGEGHDPSEPPTRHRLPPRRRRQGHEKETALPESPEPETNPAPNFQPPQRHANPKKRKKVCERRTARGGGSQGNRGRKVFEETL